MKASLQRIHNSLDLDTILSTAVRDVRQQTQADRVVIYQFRGDGQGVITHEAVVDEGLSVINRQVNDACFDQDHAITYWFGRVGQTGFAQYQSGGGDRPSVRSPGSPQSACLWPEGIRSGQEHAAERDR